MNDIEAVRKAVRHRVNDMKVSIAAIAKALDVHHETLKRFIDGETPRGDAREKILTGGRRLILEAEGSRVPRESLIPHNDEASMLEFYRLFAEETGLPGWEELQASERAVIRAQFAAFVYNVEADVQARRLQAFREMRMKLLPAVDAPTGAGEVLHLP